MPMYDRKCEKCAAVKVDCLEPITSPDRTCECGGTMLRVWLQGAANGVIGDDIPGGALVFHGICHDDGTPRRYYSKSEMARAANEKGLVNMVRHTTPQGSDRAKHTTRWI